MNTSFPSQPSGGKGFAGKLQFTLPRLIALGVCLLLGHNASATLFFTEQFDYTDGVNLGVTTSPWNPTTAGTGDNDARLKVTTASAQTAPGGYAPSAFNGVAVLPTNSNKKNAALFNGATGVPATAGNVVYASFLLNVQTLHAGNMRVAYLHNGTSSSGTMEIIVSSTGQIGIQKKGNAASLVFASGTPVATPGTHLVVLRYTFQGGSSNDEMALWVDPASGSFGAVDAPAFDATANTSAASDMSNPFTHFVIDAPNVGAAGPEFWIDEVRVADTWADVTPGSGVCVTAGITEDPSNDSVETGTTANFTVVATGTTPDYQWEVSSDGGANWVPVSTGTGGITASYTTAATTPAENNNQYRCIVSVACNSSSVISAAATLTVICNTAGIDAEPSNASVEAGQTANFLLTASGSNPTFQWELSTDNGVNWAPVSTGTGGTTASYTTAATTTAENGHQYRGIVNVACDSSSVTSAVVTLTVNCFTAGISVAPLSTQVEAGLTANFSLTGSGSSPTYQWEVSPDNGANWTPVSSGTGGTSASYTTAATTPAENGYQYRGIVNVACDSSSVTSAVATLTVNCSTAGISSDPASASVFAGQTVNFSLTASGSSPTYQWEVSTDSGANWAPVATGIGGNTASYTTAPVAAPENGYQFRGIVSVACNSSSATSAVATLTVADPAATSFRSVATGNWEDISTWEQSPDNGASWIPAFGIPTAANSTNILIKSATTVTVTASRTADNVVVAGGGTLAATATTTIANGDGVDLDVSGELLALGGSSVITLQAGTELNVRSGGVFVHNGTSGTCVNNGGGTVTFENGGKFLLQRSGGTIPTAVWSSGSTCEVNYITASTTRPGNNSHGQAFHNFHWNNVNQNGGNDLANVLTNIAGNLTVDAGLVGNIYEFKLNNSSGNANGFYGGDIIVNAGRFNWASGGGPYIWTVRGDIVINTGTAMDVSGSANGSYTLLLDSGAVQDYTCAGENLAVKLNWTVSSGTTLNLNDDLPLTAANRTLMADGIINLNGNVVATDLLAGSGTIRNESGGSGRLAVGAGNGNNILDGTLTLVNGASGSLGLEQCGSGTLTITVAQTFSGGLIVSNGTVFVENITGSGTGSGAVTVYGGTLAGNGTIAGVVSIESGATLSPGAGAGKLTINNTLTLAGDTLIEVDKANGTNDLVVAATVNYGGTLTVNDLSGGLVAGDSFTIFNAGAHTGNFPGIVGSPGANLAWSFNPTTGVLSVVTAVVNPPSLVYSQAGNLLTFSWAETGFKLQAQTNSLTTGLSSNWGDVPAGDISPVNLEVDAANEAVFFRLAPQ
jgi:autotransporter-associated beta strand protein